jgi:hypothetical protein
LRRQIPILRGLTFFGAGTNEVKLPVNLPDRTVNPRGFSDKTGSFRHEPRSPATNE